jgi:putative protease
MRTIELLAPGGDARSVKAAILAGADAVYLGVGELNARKRAVNISPDDVGELCALAHERNCRIYLTLNVIILEEDFPYVTELLAGMIGSGIDGVIVQDYGLLHVVRQMFPELELHASTQMTSHNRGQLGLLGRSGVRQVNLSRELSLGELKELTSAAHAEGLKAEVFVHGAFCVSFSGQCYISGHAYDNSANRGACVQPCRRDYLPDRLDRPDMAGSRNAPGAGLPVKPLNLKDNSLFASAAELVDAGADSLKIEGRIKGYDYVYSVVSAWREQLERLNSHREPQKNDPRLAAVFNRSFSDNLFRGRLGPDSFTPDSGDRSLKRSGTVAAYSAAERELSILPDGGSSEGKPGAGQSITIKDNEGKFVCTGTLLERKKSGAWTFRIEHRLMGKIRKRQEVWSQPRLIDFSEVDRQLDSMKAAGDKRPLRFRLSGRAGEPLVLEAAGPEQSVRAVSESAVERAEGRPSTAEAVIKQLSRLGSTPFFLEECDTSGLAEGLFIPVRVLNQLRREAVEALLAEDDPAPRSSPAGGSLPALVPAGRPAERRLAVAVSGEPWSLDILEQIPRECGVLALFQLPADPGELSASEAVFAGRGDLVPWFPSILIGDQYEAACDVLLRRKSSFIVTDNAGIAFFAQEHGIPWVGGPMLNSANGYTLDFFREHGAGGAFCSPELSAGQFGQLTIPSGMELWSPLSAPVFLMKSRHCLVRNCGGGCGKEVMDERCLPDCSRSAAINDSQGNRFLVVKNKGDYNSIWLDRLAMYPERLKDPRIGTFLLDLRAPHLSLLPEGPIGEYIRRAGEAVEALQRRP